MQYIDNYDITIVGGGCAGLFLAAMLSENLPNAFNILLLEKTKSLGNKLLLSGNGQCNFTNAGDMKHFSTKYGDKYSFLKPALYFLSNDKLINIFMSYGIESFIRDDLKVFPKSLKAEDIKNVLFNRTLKYPIDIRLNSHVTDIDYQEEVITINIAKYGKLNTKKLILCTGGASFSETGSNGDIINLVKKLNIQTNIFKHALSVPDLIPLTALKFNLLAGITLPNATFSLLRKDKKIITRSGSILFTHKSLS